MLSDSTQRKGFLKISHLYDVVNTVVTLLLQMLHSQYPQNHLFENETCLKILLKSLFKFLPVRATVFGKSINRHWRRRI